MEVEVWSGKCLSFLKGKFFMSSNIDFWSLILNSEETSKLLDNKTITICLLQQLRERQLILLFVLDLLQGRR